MKQLKSLPDGFQHYVDIRPEEYRKGHLAALIISLPLALGFYFVFIGLARINRADVVQSLSWNPNFNIFGLIQIILVFLLFSIVHELIHGAFIWIYTGETPKTVIQFPGIGIYTPEWYFPRIQMMLIELAPLFLITIFGAPLLPFIPPRFVGLFAIGLTYNVIGSYMDIAVFIYTFLLPDDSLIKLEKSHASIFVGKVDGSTWKSLLLEKLEHKIMPTLR